MNQTHSSTNYKEFEELYHTTRSNVYKFILSKIWSRRDREELAEDLTAQVYLRFFKAWQNNPTIINKTGFIFTIARNLVVDEYRKTKNTPASLEMLEENHVPLDIESNDHRRTVLKIELKHVIQHLRYLTQTDREVLTLRCIQGYSSKEIAQMRGVNHNSISVQVCRARHRLRKIIREKMLHQNTLPSRNK